jgi:hypothetical protein
VTALSLRTRGPALGVFVSDSDWAFVVAASENQIVRLVLDQQAASDYKEGQEAIGLARGGSCHRFLGRRDEVNEGVMQVEQDSLVGTRHCEAAYPRRGHASATRSGRMNHRFLRGYGARRATSGSCRLSIGNDIRACPGSGLFTPGGKQNGRMRIGVKPGQYGWSFDELVASWEVAETVGFDVLACFDHVSSSPMATGPGTPRPCLLPWRGGLAASLSACTS